MPSVESSFIICLHDSIIVDPKDCFKSTKYSNSYITCKFNFGFHFLHSCYHDRILSVFVRIQEVSHIIIIGLKTFSDQAVLFLQIQYLTEVISIVVVRNIIILPLLQRLIDFPTMKFKELLFYMEVEIGKFFQDFVKVFSPNRLTVYVSSCSINEHVPLVIAKLEPSYNS